MPRFNLDQIGNNQIHGSIYSQSNLVGRGVYISILHKFLGIYKNNIHVDKYLTILFLIGHSVQKTKDQMCNNTGKKLTLLLNLLQL